VADAEPPISERVMLKNDRYFAVSARDGSLKPDEFAGDGLWFEDTRILSRLRVLIDRAEPRLVGLRTDDASSTFELMHGPLHITRVRYIDAGLHELVTVTNGGDAPVDARLEVEAAADSAAMLAVRGAVPQLAHPPSVPARVVATPPGLRHDLRLSPRQSFSLRLDVGPEKSPPVADFNSGLQSVKDQYSRWKSECMAVRTDNEALNAVLDQAIADLRMLLNRYDTGIYPTGGMPWYVVPFGRDTLITSMLLLHVNPDIARGVLRYQARHQGTRVDAGNDEQPGKILHEVRSGEVVERGLWPHILYTTIDATALFLCALTETDTWTADHDLVRELAPAADAALQWCVRYGDVDGDGYIEDRGERYRNAGWKDSADSLTDTDGSEVLRPAALCEVQAYLYRGLVGMSRTRPELRAKAAALKRRFNRDFWMPDEKFFAQALDGAKRPVRTVTSNPGHCLWMRIADRRKAAHVAARLVSPEMFSGWGIRTLSDRAVNYDPCSYHNGSVWPFDTALAVAGMRHYGFAAEAERVARSLLESASEFPLGRPPELFCGDGREPGQAPREYWNTCTPQLWSAAGMFACVASILGLEADPAGRTLTIAPTRTRLWSWLEVKGLHFAGERVDFGVRGTEVKVGPLPAGIKVATDRPV
jgi:glycogen debranching enzyme